MTHLSLCTGIGGIDLAAERAGFRTVAVCEVDPHCRRVLSRNFPGVVQVYDVRVLTESLLRFAGVREHITLVSAGFPCQPFSVAGSRRGASDDRYLWPEIVRVLRELRPRWFLGENVRGLLSISSGATFGTILRDLADLGYRVGWGCYGADEAAGFRHQRDRVFIVGYLADSEGERGRLLLQSGESGRQNVDARRCGGNVDDTDGAEWRPIGSCGDRGGEGQNHRREANGGLGIPSGSVGDAFNFGRERSTGFSRGRPVSSGGSDQLANGTGNGREGEGCGRGENGFAGACGAELADAGCRGDNPIKPQLEPERGGSTMFSQVGDELGDSLRQSDLGSIAGPRIGFARASRHIPIPGPAEWGRWAELLGERYDLAPALSREEEAELSVRPALDGLSRRMALKMLGNAVVPDQVQPILDQIAAFERGEM